MRIIGGTFKGVKILEAFDKNTRPLKDLVKESILNILEHSKDSKINLNNSLVLDLFAGTGSFGLECISRGASNIFFADSNCIYTPSLSSNILPGITRDLLITKIKENGLKVEEGKYTLDDLKSAKYAFGHSRLITNSSIDNQPVRRNDISVLHNGIIVNEQNIWAYMGHGRTHGPGPGAVQLLHIWAVS